MLNNELKEKEFSTVFKPELWKKVFTYSKPYKKLLFFLFIVMLIVGIIDAIFPLLTRYAIDNYIKTKDLHSLPGFIFFYIILIIIQSINVWLLIALAGKIDMGMCYDIREKGFEKLQNLSFSYYDKTPVGWIMARMTSDIERLGDTFAWGFVDLIWGFTMMFGISAIMFYLNWKLALITLSTVPLLLLISIKFQKIILKSYRIVRKTNSKITGAFNEGIMGAKTTKTLTRENENLNEFKEQTYKMFKSSFTAALQSSIYLPIVLIIGSIGTALTIWFGGNGIIAGFITYGTLVAFIAYTIRFFEPIQELARIFSEFQNAQASAERIFSLLDIKPDIDDSEKVKKIIRKHSDKIFPDIKGDIEFLNVSFFYSNDKKIISNMNFKISAGQSVALVGETGSGKSTIVNLICRFYEPTSGILLIDKKDYKERSVNSIQSNIGVILQTPYLFSGSIRENIRYGNLNASNEEINEAAKIVFADKFIEKFEKGYNTEVGEHGNILSVGQKQLISFSRAILANPKIFILDEATSSVDTETEKLIQKAIKKILIGRTSIIIAHRLSTIKSCDQIFVIKNGKIIEKGNHKSLINKKGYYYKLYTNQYMEEVEKIFQH